MHCITEIAGSQFCLSHCGMIKFWAGLVLLFMGEGGGGCKKHQILTWVFGVVSNSNQYLGGGGL